MYLDGDRIFILKRDRTGITLYQARERTADYTQGRLTFIYVGGTVVEDGVQFLDGHVTVFCVRRRVDARAEKSSLYDIL